MPAPSEPTAIPDRLRWQAEWCGRLGSPLYKRLFVHAADDYDAGGPVRQILAGSDRDPSGSALALRLAGAVHRLVLSGRATDLAAHYPSAGGRPEEDAWDAFRATLESDAAELRDLLDRPVQTNEVGRAAALVGGFLLVASRTALPLAILEIGASAGLNLRWDHFRYEARGETWGPEDSPVRLCTFEAPPTPPFHVRARVVERRGCDANPVDPTTEDGRLALMSYVWPDQTARFRALKGALRIAGRVPATVERARATEWLERALATPRRGAATVVFHSIVWQYLSEEDRARVTSLLYEAGARASDDAPIAWLRMEPGGEQAAVHLTSWPGGDTELIAESGYHGSPVTWKA
jgi:hypothetical protein